MPCCLLVPLWESLTWELPPSISKLLSSVDSTVSLLLALNTTPEGSIVQHSKTRRSLVCHTALLTIGAPAVHHVNIIVSVPYPLSPGAKIYTTAKRSIYYHSILPIRAGDVQHYYKTRRHITPPVAQTRYHHNRLTRSRNLYILYMGKLIQLRGGSFRDCSVVHFGF